MPLIPTAKPAIADRDRRAVSFVMKDGTKPISILVSNPALENIEIAPPVDEGYFFTFKLYRRSFEKIASREPSCAHTAWRTLTGSLNGVSAPRVWVSTTRRRARAGATYVGSPYRRLSTC